jgi:hypothetical protein
VRINRNKPAEEATMAIKDPQFRENFLEGLEEFSKQSEELGGSVEAAENRAFARRFTAAFEGRWEENNSHSIVAG